MTANIWDMQGYEIQPLPLLKKVNQNSGSDIARKKRMVLIHPNFMTVQ